MSIDKLEVFASQADKNTDGLTLKYGFPSAEKPARQWFNWLFYTQTAKINEVVDLTNTSFTRIKDMEVKYEQLRRDTAQQLQDTQSSLQDVREYADQLMQTAVGGKLAYKTYAEMIADKSNIAAKSSIDIIADTDDKNGTYLYDGADFVKSQYDVEKVIRSKVQNTFGTYAQMVVSNLSDGAYALVADDADDKNGIYIKEGGVWVKSKYDPAKNVSEENSIRVFKEDSFTESTSKVEYSAIPVTPLRKGETVGLIRCQSQSGAYVVVSYSINNVRTTLVDIMPSGEEDVLKVFKIPDDAVSIRAFAANSLYENYNPLKSPVLLLGNDEDKLFETLYNMENVFLRASQIPAYQYKTYEEFTQVDLPEGVLVHVYRDLDDSKNGYYYNNSGEWVFKKQGIKSLLDNYFDESDPTYSLYDYEYFVNSTSREEYSSTDTIYTKPGDKLYIHLQSKSGAEIVSGRVNGVRTVLEPVNRNASDIVSKFVELPEGTTWVKLYAANSKYTGYAFDPYFIIGKDEEEILKKVEKLNQESVEQQVIENAAKVFSSDSVLETPTLKAVREIFSTDGTERLVVEYLWHDKDFNFYTSSSVKGAKIFAFKYNPASFENTLPTDWSMGFDKYGNILCTFRIEYQDWNNYSDSLTRKNPVILLKSEGYKAKTIDFGDDKKPSAWIQNSGFLATEDAIFIAEYTRPSVQTANCWKATYPLDDPNNWKTVQTFVLSEEPYPSDNLKHMHSVERDPFTGHIYTTTGDEDAGSAMYVSIDNGETFSAILTGSQKYCRVLNFVYTEDFIYWATDSVGGKHWFFKAPRNNSGILDTSNITDVQMFPLDSPATYATIHLPKIKALIFLNREDYKASNPITIDAYDLHNDVFIEKLAVIDSVGGGAAGFRCECFEYVPRGNDIVCGFSGASSYRNSNAVLGNKGWNSTSKLGNLIVTVDRIGTELTLSISTTV